MSVTAVQSYVQKLLNNLTVPAYSETPVVAYIAPPIPGDAGVPSVFIWGGTWTERRQTAPRGKGFKEVVYNLDLWVIVVQSNERPDSDTAFPSLIEALMNVLRQTPMPTFITDPVTNVQSQVLSVGESFEVDYSPVHTVADQVDVQYTAWIKATIKEAFQG